MYDTISSFNVKYGKHVKVEFIYLHLNQLNQLNGEGMIKWNEPAVIYRANDHPEVCKFVYVHRE